MTRKVKSLRQSARFVTLRLSCASFVIGVTPGVVDETALPSAPRQTGSGSGPKGTCVGKKDCGEGGRGGQVAYWSTTERERERENFIFQGERERERERTRKLNFTRIVV